MRVWAITLTHVDLPLLEYSLGKFYETINRSFLHKHVLVDHHWPLDYWNHRRSVLHLAEKYGCSVIAPYQNMGAHGGYNWAMSQIHGLVDDDLILGYDADSNPQVQDWNRAMVEVLEDKQYAAVSLSINADLNTKSWEDETVNGVIVKRPAHGCIEMFNVTMWRLKFLQSTQGLRANSIHYGLVEGPMFYAMREQGLKHGYLKNFHEDLKPFEPDARYQLWKNAHLCGYKWNFDQYLIDVEMAKDQKPNDLG